MHPPATALPPQLAWTHQPDAVDREAAVSVQLKDLVGTTILQGCEWGKVERGRYNGEVDVIDVIHFQLGPTTYSMYEDPDDGYRSHLGKIEVDQHEITNTFAPCVVVCTHHTITHGQYENGKAVDILEIRCAETGKLIIEVGTDNTDDYYPSCVMSFNPENLPHNADVPSPVKPAGPRT